LLGQALLQLGSGQPPFGGLVDGVIAGAARTFQQHLVNEEVLGPA
jgi:hypothetical protein